MESHAAVVFNVGHNAPVAVGHTVTVAAAPITQILSLIRTCGLAPCSCFPFFTVLHPCTDINHHHTILGSVLEVVHHCCDTQMSVILGTTRCSLKLTPGKIKFNEIIAFSCCILHAF